MADQIMRRDSEEDMDSQKAFSLVELLVVISIVLALITLIVVVISATRNSGHWNWIANWSF